MKCFVKLELEEYKCNQVHISLRMGYGCYVHNNLNTMGIRVFTTTAHYLLFELYLLYYEAPFLIYIFRISNFKVR